MPDPEGDAHRDAALVARVLRSDDRGAFEQLVLRHQGRVRAQLRQLTRGDQAWADDLAQEAFLLAWRKLRQFRAESRFSTWLFRIAYTTFLQALRRRRSETRHAEFEVADMSREASDPTLALDIESALQTLPDNERMALQHCYHLDLSHDEAARVLGIPLGTVKTYIARGKKRLKTLLGPWDEQRSVSRE